MIMTTKTSTLLFLNLLAATGCSDSESGGIADNRALYQVSTLTGTFDGSGGLTVDSNGQIYVADFGDQIDDADGTTVSKIDPITGAVTEFATGLDGPSGNVFHSNGNLFQANIAGNAISEITPDGDVTEFASGGLRSPVGVVFDGDGNLYVCNCGAASIQVITPDGTSSRFVENSLLNCPNGLTIDDDGNLYAANFNNGRVIKVSPDKTVEVFAIIPGGNNAHLVFSDGVIYVLSRQGNQLYQLDLDGTVTLIAGTGSPGNVDGSGEQASFFIPNGIGVSPDGTKIYVVSRVVGTGSPLNPVLVRVVSLK